MVQPEPTQIAYPEPAQQGAGKMLRRRSVRLASWLSIIPGLGQFYNRQPKKAGIFLLAVVGLFLFTLNIPGATGQLLAFWKPRGSVMVLLSLFVEILSLLIFMTTFLLALIFWYDAMHDAQRTAQELNGERQPGGRWWWFHR
jgi:arabinogalactan oligomer/maltooligosaccharide transport system permease protein